MCHSTVNVIILCKKTPSRIFVFRTTYKYDQLRGAELDVWFNIHPNLIIYIEIFVVNLLFNYFAGGLAGGNEFTVQCNVINQWNSRKSDSLVRLMSPTDTMPIRLVHFYQWRTQSSCADWCYTLCNGRLLYAYESPTTIVLQTGVWSLAVRTKRAAEQVSSDS